MLDIVNDLIMRMEAQSRIRDSFDMEGIVLIDEIETHLHLEELWRGTLVRIAYRMS